MLVIQEPVVPVEHQVPAAAVVEAVILLVEMVAAHILPMALLVHMTNMEMAKEVLQEQHMVLQLDIVFNIGAAQAVVVYLVEEAVERTEHFLLEQVVV
jgi:hypothetical protein